VKDRHGGTFGAAEAALVFFHAGIVVRISGDKKTDKLLNFVVESVEGKISYTVDNSSKRDKA
jgi:hypothetical protein